MIDLTDEGFTANDFEPVGVFGSRGIGPEAVKGAFYRYEQEADVRAETVFNGPSDDMNDVIGRAVRRARRLAKKARGMMMVSFPVPDANPFIFNEQRPDWAIWVGDPTYPAWMGGIPDPHDHDNDFTDASISLKRHVNRGKTNVEHVEKGVTPDEYAALLEIPEFCVVGGADHFGTPCDPSAHPPASSQVPVQA